MGRGKLGKIDPALDLSRHLLPLKEAPCPLEPASYFPNTAPLEIEVGCGKGMFIAAAAQENPQRNFLGIEIAWRYAEYCAAALAEAEVENALMLQGDGEKLFREYLADNSAAAVHVYFPDPWWKQRHWKRRIMNAPFLEQVQRVMEPGAVLHFWTDVEPYFRKALGVVQAATSLQGPFEPAPDAAEYNFEHRTHFDRRMQQRERPIYRAYFLKN
ncbi:tRNA (guanosine(46)-N7)-methyltransferase TrmB [Lignipirellula cremea]|uniref:tRNA (guanine-N(7)-)-methyltransferase n=1 Tax=Lignipirellula cremea TaxID=2528010 RepID=A0A518E3Q3_9BACT|nr:tRNA (guanosine(46)-N7)-methyltransferase TrmB [Lignipirellula cremea]QDU98673.1 tRNA (guanine-N(7)-)-methyltransferase [Lignipirellula cremea]